MLEGQNIKNNNLLMRFFTLIFWMKLAGKHDIGIFFNFLDYVYLVGDIFIITWKY